MGFLPFDSGTLILAFYCGPLGFSVFSHLSLEYVIYLKGSRACLCVCEYVEWGVHIGSTQDLISFSLILFQESQDRNGDISQTNAEIGGIQFINYFLF